MNYLIEPEMIYVINICLTALIIRPRFVGTHRQRINFKIAQEPKQRFSFRQVRVYNS
jgi:hypothetical protein